MIPRSPEMARDEIGMTLRSPEVILGCGPVSGALGDVDFISGHLGPSRAASESPRGDAPTRFRGRPRWPEMKSG